MVNQIRSVTQEHSIILMPADNWEFGDYGAQFGMQYVNRTSQERRFKKSLFDLVDFVESRRGN